MWISRFMQRKGMQEEGMLELMGMLMFMKNSMKFYATYCFIYNENTPLTSFVCIICALLRLFPSFCTFVYFDILACLLPYKLIFFEHFFYRSFSLGHFFERFGTTHFFYDIIFLYICFIFFISSLFVQFFYNLAERQPI